MPEIIGVTVWLLAGWYWGDWRNWKRYESTILFMIFVDTLYYYTSIDHRLWSLEPQPPFRSEIIALFGEYAVFTSAILMFLGRFPSGFGKGWFWVLFWIVIFSINEWVLLLTGTFSYSNGWTLLDSIIFCCVMFPMLRLHNRRSLLAYALSVPIAIFYLWHYDIPLR